MRAVPVGVVFAVLVAGCGGTSTTRPVLPAAEPPAQAIAPAGPSVTHGLAIGDARSDAAILWARADGEAELMVSLEGGPGEASPATAIAERDFTMRVPLTGLAPATRYRVKAWFRRDGVDGAPATASFSTPPRGEEAAPLRFAFGGDLGGQNACRDAERGYPIFEPLNALELDFFIGLGDMIYADGVCEAEGLFSEQQVPLDAGPSSGLPDYWAHWRYNWADPGVRELRSKTSYVAIWDDHETVNDVGPKHDTRDEEPYRSGEHLLPLGERAFRDHNPLGEGPLYRELRWGKHVQLLILDTRSYRDDNKAADEGPGAKSMLGEKQLRWLQTTLADTEATWTVIVSSVPIAIPTGGPLPDRGRDGWANHDQPTGFERELRGIFDVLRVAGRRNNLWLTTDVHFAAAFRHRPFGDDFTVHELVTGPLSAGVYPNQAFDETFGTERTFFHGPEDPDGIADLDEALGWFNFGTVDVDGDGGLVARVVDGRGKVLHELALEPSEAR